MAVLMEQLQAMRGLAENWDGYGAAAPQPDAIDLAQELVGLVEDWLHKSMADPPVLHVSPTRIGGVLIEWEDRSIVHEVEINPDRSIGFLHLNRSTGQIETRKFVASLPAVVHPGFLQELRHLLAA
jgi:hypothetical protein